MNAWEARQASVVFLLMAPSSIAPIAATTDPAAETSDPTGKHGSPGHHQTWIPPPPNLDPATAISSLGNATSFSLRRRFLLAPPSPPLAQLHCRLTPALAAALLAPAATALLARQRLEEGEEVAA